MANKLTSPVIFTDGRKSILLEQYPDDAWDFYSNGPQAKDTDNFKFIPTLFRGATLRGQAVSSMPFELYRGNSEDPVDTSEDWQNTIGFLPNPFVLLQLVEMALTLTGRAYLFRERSQVATKQLRYIIPTSVTPQIDPIKGLTGFKRDVNGMPKDFTLDDIVYFWAPDPSVEAGPPIAYPGQAAANACGVLKNIDIFSSQFFERGAIKAMLLTVKGMPLESERQKLNHWWKSVVSGIKNAFGAQVINADAVTPVVVGEGMKELENQNVTEEKRRDVALALGIPASMLFANAANYATANQDDLNWLNNTVIPECKFIQSILNEQIFKPLGYDFQFLPETLDALQEDERQRSDALVKLTSVLADPVSEIAMDILGYEISEEQLAKLQKLWRLKQERAEEMAQQLVKPVTEVKPERETAEEENEQERLDKPEDDRVKSDLEKWRVKSLKRLREGESAAVTFTSDFIPADRNAEIIASLAHCTTADEVRAVFTSTNGNGHKEQPNIEAQLVDALKEAVIALRETAIDA